MVQTYDFDTNYDLISTYAKTPDSNPAIGRIEEIDQFYIAAGFSGHGFMVGPAVGEMIAELITKEGTHLPIWWYDPYRFERGELRELDEITCEYFFCFSIFIFNFL